MNTTYLKTREVATLLRVCVATVCRLCERGELNAIRIGGNWRIPANAIEQIIKKEGKNHYCTF